MRICVVTPRYAISGVPLAQLRFARALAQSGHAVDLMIGRRDAHLAVPHVPGVNVIVLQRSKVRGMLVPLWRYLRRRRPDVIFSAEDHLNALVLFVAILARSKAKISGSSRVTPFDTYSSIPFTKRWLLKQFMRAVSWRADALTCVSRDMVEQYRQVFGSHSRQVCVYNIVDDPSSRARIGEMVDDPWLNRKDLPVVVAAGTLAPWKGFDDLIHAIGELARKGRRVRLLILGEGSSRTALEALIARLGLSDLVRLVGYVDNPLKYYAHADAFVLSSHVEGLPNVLVEAMMCGRTPVSTDCPTGPREVLQDGQLGYLVPVRDPAALAVGIEQALDHPLPDELLARGVEPFEQTVVLRRHFDILGLA